MILLLLFVVLRPIAEALDRENSCLLENDPDFFKGR